MGSDINVHIFAIPKAHASDAAISKLITANPIAKAISSVISSTTSKPAHAELGIVAVMVENKLLDDKTSYSGSTLREYVFAYAENIQKRLPHTRAIVMGVDSNEDTFKISTILEKMYYEGVDNDLLDTSKINDDTKKEDDNRLVGIVLVGNIPLPIVYDRDGVTSPSLYPYTDFYRKRYIYNHNTDRFELNPDALKPTPDVWHGVIVPPSKDNPTRKKELAEYFDKNNKYSNNQDGYSTFNKRMLYYNFPAVEKKLNTFDYSNYKRAMKYLEEIVFHRFNRHLLKAMVSDISGEMAPDKAEKDQKPLIDDISIKRITGSGIELVIKKFTKSFAQSLQTYLGRLNSKIAKTGRWSEKEYDSFASLITMRDTYMQTILMAKTIELEKLIDKEISSAQETVKVITGVAIDSEESFNFSSYIDGTKVSSMLSTSDAGLYRGQLRPVGIKVVENNSVLVEANRLYNPDTGIIPPDGDTTKMEERAEYNEYGGCVANNSIKYDNNDKNIHIGPNRCDPTSAIKPVFDIAGSKESGYKLYRSSDTNPPSNFKLPDEQFLLENMSFLPSSMSAKGLYADGSDFKKKAYCNSSLPAVCSAPLGIAPDTDLDETINRLFSKLVSTEEIKLDMADKADVALLTGGKTIAHKQLSKILHTLLPKGLIQSRSFNDDGNVTVKFTATTKDLKTMIKHVEPSDTTIASVCESQVTEAYPSDGIRYVEFYKDKKRRVYKYPNLFRIEGNSQNEILQNLSKEILKKDKELNDLLGSQKNIISKFFTTNAALVEPIQWRQLGVDQKHQSIFEKYLNRDSFMPVPDSTAVPPSTQPKGYEVVHIYAKGDEESFQFAINRSNLDSKALIDSELDAAKKSLKDKEKAVGKKDATSDATSSDTKSLYKCGPSDGVEIWEWFPNLIGCWIPNEVIKLADLVTLDNSCGGDLPQPDEDALDNSGADIFSNPELAVENPANKPATLKVIINKKTLVQGEKVPVKVEVLNKKGKKVLGYISNPLEFKVVDNSLADLDQSKMNIFIGEGKIDMNAKNKSGKTSLDIKLGSLTSKTPINVIDGIKVKLAHKKVEGQPYYNITAQLYDLSDNAVTDVNTDIKLSSVKPSDGKFAPPLVSLKDGKGQSKFFPNPASTNIALTAVHSVYKSDILTVPPIVNEPFKIVISTPKNLPVGKEVKIPVKVTDIYGTTSVKFGKYDENFKCHKETIKVKVTKKMSQYGSVESDTVTIKNGVGEIKVKVGKETGQLNLIAEHDKLAPGMAEMPIIAKISQEDWSENFPQDLFASFVGFPAGNFLKENYFGGVHLFSGKTQAVYASMSDIPIPPTVTVMPNYQIKLGGSSQTVDVSDMTDKISLQVIDKKTLESLLSTTVDLDFNKIAVWDRNAKPVSDTIYYELTNSNYTVTSANGVVDIFDADDEKVVTLKKDSISFKKFNHTLSFEDSSNFNLLELVLSNATDEVARLYLNFKPKTLKENDFVIDSDYGLRSLFSGNSTNDPTGLILYDTSVEPEESKRPTEHFGFEKENKYILRFGGGSPIGEATMWNLPFNSVLLGDPTIKLTNQIASSLNYDNTVGRQIYQDDEEGDIVAITNFDFNKDNIEDIAVVTKDGRIRLFEGGHTDPLYRDRGNIAFLADGVLSIASFDFKNDGYDDLVVATKAGRLAILHNNKEVLTRTNQKLKVGKQLYQISKADMDADGYPDLVTLDSLGDIRIFYNNNNVLPENGVLIGNYGFSLKLTENLKNDLKIRYPNMPEPKDPTAVTSSAGKDAKISNITPTADNPLGISITPPKATDLTALTSFQTKDTSKDISDSAAKAAVDAFTKDAKAVAELGAPASQKIPWNENGESSVYFESFSNFEKNYPFGQNGLSLIANKSVINKDRPTAKNLDLKETLKYTIKLTASKDVKDFILLDTIPDSLTLDEDSVDCKDMACKDMEVTANGVHLFLSKLNLKAKKTITITYEVAVKYTPRAAIMINKLDGKIKLNMPKSPNPAVPFDNYKDILVSPPFNTTGQLIAHYTTTPRKYSITSTKKEEDKTIADALSQNSKCMDELKKLGSLKKDAKVDASAMDNMMKACGLDKVQKDLKECKIDPNGGKPTPTPEQCAANPSKCAADTLRDVSDSISNFLCMGGGCFPMPFNMAFLAPKTIPFAMPLLAFPATLITPIGPLPVPSFFAMAPTPLGAAEIPGPIMSMIRLYTIPTLTGGLAMAFCWGPFPPGTPVPPPLMPIPYPPPIGNCMTFALPMGGLPQCKAIEAGITSLMDAANSVINDANSGIAAVNNGGNLPAELSAVDSTEGGAGGLEVGLAINLGNQMKFEPPTKTFSNKHIGSYDSIGGKIAGWLDKQMLEIFNKLLNLPTIRFILPDTTKIFSADWDEFDKLTTAWWNGVTGLGKQATTAGTGALGMLKATGGAVAGMVKGDANNIKNAGGKFLDNYTAVEQEVVAFNQNTIEDLYAVVNSIPFINLNEHYIDFKIPYLSYAQINDVIRDFEGAKLYYKKQAQKYNDLLAKYKAQFTCPKADKNKKECVAIKILGMFTLDLSTFIKSIEDNIDVFRSYMNFPKQVIMFFNQLSQYLSQLACILETFANLISGWLVTIQNQMIGYVEVFYTIIEIVKNIKKLVDIFTNFETNCDICTNDRMGNFGWIMLLGLVIPEIPIIKFPKWPDLVFDLSDFKAEINIEFPTVHFIGEPIKLPRIPRIKFPDLPDLTLLKLGLQLPALPVLPKLPDLPKLPPLPAVPTVNLPTLPPPPKLPDIGASFEVISELLEMLLMIWCMIKKGFSPVPEGYLGDHAVLLTNRPAYLMPLDMLQIKFGDIAVGDMGFDELRIESKVYMSLRLKLVAEGLQKTADDWNKAVPTDFQKLIDESFIGDIAKGLDKFEKFADELSDDIDKFSEDFADTIEDAGKYHQKALDMLGKELKDVDDMFRGAESDLQDLSDTATDIMGEGTKIANQAMVNKLAEYNKWADGVDKNMSEIMRKAATEAWVEWVGTSLTFGLSAAGKAINEVDVKEWLQEHIFNLVGKGIDDAIAKGVMGEFEVGKFINSYLQPNAPEWLANMGDELSKNFDELRDDMKKTGDSFRDAYMDSKLRTMMWSAWAQDTTSNQEAYIPQINQKQRYEVPPELKDAFTNKIEGMIAVIDEVNRSEPIEYSVLKEKYGVPDYQLPIIPTAVDKIHSLQIELLKKSKEYADMAVISENQEDLYAFVQNQLEPPSPYKLASSKKKTVTTNISGTPDLEKLIANKPQAPPIEYKRLLAQASSGKTASSSSSVGSSSNSSSGACVGTCLIDPITNKSIQFIPYFDNPAITKTAFIPSGIPGKSHVVYSDGPVLYLKRELTVPLSTTINIPPRVPNIIFNLDDFITAGGSLYPYREAVNMVAPSLTENGSASFNWAEITHPDLYGAGIELERSILGYDVDKQKNGLADITIVLLPPDSKGNAPRVTIDGNAISYGTLVTSLADKKEARKRFGIETKSFYTRANKVLFETVGNDKRNLGITLTPTRAVYFDKFSGSGYNLNMDNGFHHIKATWFDKYGRIANYNHNELLSPQIYVDTAAPIDMSGEKTFKFPIYKKGIINVSEIYTDLSESYNYYWDTNQDGLMDVTGAEYAIYPQKKPKKFTVDLIASIDLNDSSFTQYKKKIKIEIYVPKISLEEEPLISEGKIKGTMQPEDKSHNLKDIPFSLFRKRWGIWKNLGLLKAGTNEQTTPPLSDKNGWKNNYYALNKDGDYEISGFTHGLSNALISDGSQNDVVRVHLKTGQIEMLNNDYELKVIPASWLLPTRVAVVKKAFDTALSNIYYIADSNTDAVILDTPITQTNLSTIGITLGDLNTSDSITAENMPGYTESFPGGATIFNKDTKINIALINSDGAVRMMSTGYSLGFKNQGKLTEKIIFQLIDDKTKKPVFDIFVAANFDLLVINQDEVWNDLKTQIGYLKKRIGPMFASLFAQNKPNKSSQNSTKSSKPNISKPTTSENPFQDLDSGHPNYKAILDLYKRRIVGGYGDGTFRPDAKLSRAEFVKIALGATNCFDCTMATNKQKTKYIANPFPDVFLPAWYFYCISIAKELGMVTGYGDGVFRPGRNISRAEAVAVLLRQSGIELEEAPKDYYVDVPEYAWYVDYIHTAVESELIKEQQGIVAPDEEITRGEFAFMASGVLALQDCSEVDTDEDGMPDWWEMDNDLDPLFAGDALLDNDDDGITNLHEYKNTLCPYLDNPNQTDTDGDKKIDVCDDDIDNDGIKNELGIYDKDGKLDNSVVDNSDDNCLFVANLGQEDSDDDGVGDACEECPYLNNPNQNDLDGDGIIDVCDDDLDNDGTKNVLGIYDENGLIDPEKVAESDDNCIFIINEDQTDINADKLGDICEALPADQVGPPKDLCPAIPEDLDWYHDDDGCPELNDALKKKTAEDARTLPDKTAEDYYKKKPGVYINKGPACYFLDYENDIVKDDIIMTAITDVDTHDIIYTQSGEIPY